MEHHISEKKYSPISIKQSFSGHLIEVGRLIEIQYNFDRNRFRNSTRVLLHRRRNLNPMVKIQTWGARIFEDFQCSSNKVILSRFWLERNSGSALSIVSSCYAWIAPDVKVYTCTCLWLVIMKKKLHFSFSCWYQLSPYWISSVTISLRKINCWVLNGDLKKHKLNNTQVYDSKKVAVAT